MLLSINQFVECGYTFGGKKALSLVYSDHSQAKTWMDDTQITTNRTISGAAMTILSSDEDGSSSDRCGGSLWSSDISCHKTAVRAIAGLQDDPRAVLAV
jgi:hypothetical protein